MEGTDSYSLSLLAEGGRHHQLGVTNEGENTPTFDNWYAA